ncbi:MAG: hypothetical protein IKX45_02300, partial [Bacteroidales bacterium]|nr:hypothetical protein [Bacteroidales bacterium]
NYNNYYPGNIYNTNNDKYFLRQNNNYQINKKEDIDTLIYPQSDKIYLPKKITLFFIKNLLIHKKLTYIKEI